MDDQSSEKRGATKPHTVSALVNISVGELFDKISILEIKLARITDTGAAANVECEWKALVDVRDECLQLPNDVDERVKRSVGELREVNERLWEIEDEIRLCERNGDFGDRFIELARSVYFQNDRRGALKREINQLAGSRIVEEKLYVRYR